MNLTDGCAQTGRDDACESSGIANRYLGFDANIGPYLTNLDLLKIVAVTYIAPRSNRGRLGH